MKHVFFVSNQFEEKHIVLKSLFDVWKLGVENTNYSQRVTDLGKSLSYLDLMDKSKLNKDTLDLVILYLQNQDLIRLFAEDEDKNQKNHRWIITDLGKEAHANNRFINERGMFYRKFFVQSVGLLIALASLFVSIWSLSYNSSLENQLYKQDKKVRKLEYKMQEISKQVY